MTLVELLAGLEKPTHQSRVLIALHFAATERSQVALTTSEIRDLLRQARVPRATKINVADVVARAGPLLDQAMEATGPRRWSLTDSGEAEVKRLLSRGEREGPGGDERLLRAVAAQLRDDLVRDYVTEAIVCLEAGAFRAAIVFLWTAAIRHLQESALETYGAKAVTAAIQVHQPSAKAVSRVDDFSAVKDKFTLLGLRELGLLDKSQWQTLQEALDLRNRCGHPGRFKPGEKKTSAFIEDLVGTAIMV